MLNNINPEQILFLDIETVPAHPAFDLLDKPWQELWERKAAYLKKEEHETAGDIYNRAGIYAEFGKIICISVGALNMHDGKRSLRIKSFYGDDEKELLADFARLLHEKYHKQQHLLCAHNGKEFDFPYLSRRMLINGIRLPEILNTSTKKPWEVQHLDTMELWKFGDFKSYTPLNLLAAIFNIPSPKDDIDGSMVWKIYWNEKDLERIVTYCQKDVITVVQILLKYRLEPLLDESEIVLIQ